MQLPIGSSAVHELSFAELQACSITKSPKLAVTNVLDKFAEHRTERLKKYLAELSVHMCYMTFHGTDQRY